MPVLDTLARFLSLEPFQQPSVPISRRAIDHQRVRRASQRLQERAIDSFTDFPPSIQEQMSIIFSGRDVPWRPAGIKMALGVPAILRAVTLISNVTGALSLKAYRNGETMPDADRPRLIVRPNPRSTPRTFFRDTAYYMATRGEAWWWVAKRDIDGSAMSLIPIHPREIRVEENSKNRLEPIITWATASGQRVMPNEDMRQITLMPDENGLRGVGPLQLCGAAVSVAVEAQEWAANFFAEGGYPSMLIKARGELREDPETGVHEADTLREQWMSKDHNTPRVVDEGIEDVKQFDPPSAGAAMLDSRDYQNGEAGRMFGIPGSLLDYSTPGSSLTYQNLEQEFSKWVRSGLWPNYLEGIEQEMSDLLTRSTTARFNLDALLRPDSMTRWNIYEKSVTVLGPEEGAEYARTHEGLKAGDVENAPVPFAPPQAIPTRLPIQERSLKDLTCQSCGKLAGRIAGPAEIKCSRCGRLVTAA